MPTVKGKKYPYTKSGKKAADRARKKLKNMKPVLKKYTSKY